MRPLRVFVFLAALLMCCGLQAQQLRFKHLTSEEGLSTNFVRCIVQDKKGFMWFGTQDGLNKYDGFQLRVFKNDPTSKTSLSNSDITTLTQVREDLIVVGTAAGINFFNPVTEKFAQPAKSPAHLLEKVNCVLASGGDKMLVGCNQGLYELDLLSGKPTTRKFPAFDSIEIRSLAIVAETLYVGTANQGLWRIINGANASQVVLKKEDYLRLPADAASTITHIQYYGGKLYLGTYGRGILVVDQNFMIDKIISFAKHNDNSNYIKNFVFRNNRIYAATAHGFILYNLITEVSVAYVRDDSEFCINSNPCNCAYVDSENNLWIGTDLGGVNISFIRSQKFPNSVYSYESKFSNIYSFYEIARNKVLLGGVQTLTELNPESGASTDRSKFLLTGTALCMEKESDNVYWIGTWGNGIYRYEMSTGRTTNVLSNKLGGTILCLKRHGDFLYAGSLGDGLFRINLKTLESTRFTEKDGLPNQSINTIFEDSKNNVWLGTYDGGLVMMSGYGGEGKLPVEKIFSNKGKQNEIPSNAVFGINEDKKGNIWVATSTGLGRLTGDNFRNFYEKDGLPNSYLYAILRDSLDNFWISSNSGLIRFNPQVADEDIVFKSYGPKDGLLNTEYNMGAAHLSASGTMYFGGARGFNRFRPTAIRDNLHAPEAYVIGYTRGGKDVDTDTLIMYKKHLELSWSENFFQFELVALDYTDPAKNKFRYMLEGYDKGWSAPTNVRFVSYTELPGGKYTFKVKAANNDGVWNEKPFEIRIRVIPPFWKTKTFYVLVVIFGIAVVIAFTQYRTRAIKRENKILENKVAERTRELEEKNHDIMSSIQYAKRIQEAILPAKDHIFQKLRKIFILYRPKDIVSGDFYWFAEKNGVKVFAVVDCTGHGVPGAFMSMIGHNLLHQIVLDKGKTDPAEILDELHKGVQKALRQGHNEINTNDGMDVSLIAINDEAREVRWAGANRPLVLIDANGKFDRLEGNKFPVGGAQLHVDRKFTSHIVKVSMASMAYMFSDGYADQFGGDKGKKFMVKRFHEVLLNIHHFSAEEQKKELERNFDQWRSNHEQVDDVLIVGLEI